MGQPGRTFFAQADVISIHCPLFPETKGMVNRETIELMKKTAFVINTARGGCIVEQDLAAALNSGRIAGAAVDVVSQEPMKEDNPLLTAKNIIITPHIAWAPREVRQRLLQIAGDNMGAFFGRASHKCGQQIDFKCKEIKRRSYNILERDMCGWRAAHLKK